MGVVLIAAAVAVDPVEDGQPVALLGALSLYASHAMIAWAASSASCPGVGSR